MKNTLKKLLVICLSIPLLLLTACESSQDKKDKPIIAKDILEQSLNVCRDARRTENYEEKLREILLDTYTSDLKVLRNNGVTICLDSRLDNQDTGLLDTRAIGIYYPKERVASLANGEGYSLLSKLADDFNEKSKLNLVGYKYVTSTTTNNVVTITTHRAWKKAANFDQDTITKNPELFARSPIR